MIRESKRSLICICLDVFIQPTTLCCIIRGYTIIQTPPQVNQMYIYKIQFKVLHGCIATNKIGNAMDVRPDENREFCKKENVLRT